MSQLHGQRVFRRSALPSAKQLGLHVDYATFVDCFEPGNYRAIARAAIANQLSGDAQSELHQRIAAQILDMIYNNGAYLVPLLPENEASAKERQALINDLAKYRYYAVNLNNVQSEWGIVGKNYQRPHKEAIEGLLVLLGRCQYAVRRRS